MNELERYREQIDFAIASISKDFHLPTDSMHVLDVTQDNPWLWHVALTWEGPPLLDFGNTCSVLVYRSGNQLERTNIGSYHTGDDTASDDIGRAVQAYFSARKENRCHECGRPVEQEQQIGLCVYAKPCGHRLYQGTLKESSEPETLADIPDFETFLKTWGEPSTNEPF